MRALPAPASSPSASPHVLLLASEPQSVRAAREFVREHLEKHVPDASSGHVDTCLLVTSELVTNSVRYGSEPGDLVRLVLDADDARTRVEVHDPVRRRPRRRPESALRGHGRGLLILDTLCAGRWGVSDRPMGKAVWAEVKAT
ncbi:ATP-binding protein [Streptomyces xinghaiensis]|uniref:ATP-binding protein n=1 Tax=Streptomyces xinghaiensis TaxID=1038928 RepID=UPI000BB06D4C|nr:ATP-binding protein [Streptomyces xinghaiensis]MZE75803.1 ATP-binding protein [Streptomyces sp. SID5475]